LALSLLLPAALFAGGQKESSTPKVTIVRVWDIQTQADRQMIETATERFNSEHPNIKVEPEWFQNNPYKDKIRIALGAGNPPDIFQLGRRPPPELRQREGCRRPDLLP